MKIALKGTKLLSRAIWDGSKTNRLQQPGLWIGVSSVMAGGGLLAYQVATIRSTFTHMFPHGVLDLEKKGPSYIYIDYREMSDEVPRDAVLLSDVPTSTQWYNIRLDLSMLRWPRKLTWTYNYWDLLHRAKTSKKRKRRLDAVRRLADLHPLHEADCLQIAQASDIRTAIGLARSKAARSSLLLKPPLIADSMEPEMEKAFRNIIGTLPKQGVAHCVAYITRHVMERGHFYHTAESSGDWYFGSEAGMKGKSLQRVGAETMRVFYLDALLSHSTVPSHRKLIVEKGGLLLLMQVIRNSPKIQVKSVVAQIVGNLALDESLHQNIVTAGWAKILAGWMRSNELEVSLPATRALANLDRDALNERFDDGVYLLHPVFRIDCFEDPNRHKPLRSDETKLTADVVFVHGLAGGAFKTWRQRDEDALLQPLLQDGRDEGMENQMARRRDFQVVVEDMTMISKKRLFPGQPDVNCQVEDDKKYQNWFKLLRASGSIPNQTSCWPKDWLPVDCPFVRIVSIDFDAEVSEWFRKCPVESEKCTIEMRSYDLLQRLMEAGIGQRPIIWITHSMGGLLVKKLLVTSSNSTCPHENSMWKNTKGVVFFSVPHRGSMWANWGGTEKLIMLSTEVQELKFNSPALLELHDRFRQLAESVRLPCLSFGETLKTKLGLKVEALFVPPYSSDPGFGEFISVGTDHINVCKPVDRKSKLYLRILEFIFSNISHTFMDTLMTPAFREIDIENTLDEYFMW